MSDARKTTSIKATETSRKVRHFIEEMNRGAHLAKAEGKLVAYTMVSSIYDEILRAMDIYPVWTENYAGLCAAKRMAEPYLLEAEAEGFSNVVCGYVRTGIGFDAVRHKLGQNPPDAPDGGMAEPDLLLGSSSYCDPRYKWYQALGRYLDKPTYSHDVVVPPIEADLNEVKDYYIRYQTEELRGLVRFLEQHAKRKLDQDRLWEIIRIADETGRVWYETYQLRKAVPAPMPSQDHFSCIVPGFYMMGTKEALDFYKELYQEVKYRAANTMSHVAEEKYRLIWAGGLPPWHTMWIFNYIESKGAVFAIETTYRPNDPVEVPASVTDPVEYIAYRAFLRSTYRHEKARRNSKDPRVEIILENIGDYKIDGMVSHASRSCRASTIGQVHWSKLCERYAKIPFLQLTSDIVDLRDYSQAQWKTQIDTFIETVVTHKEAA